MTKRRDLEARFHERYSMAAGEAAKAVEREAIGANVGANGYTTLAQADLLARHLELGPDGSLLDIGSGRGWPAVHLAASTGCRAVLLDLPPPALAIALERAGKQGLADRVSVIRGSATHFPFAARSFDALSHTDTL